MDQAPSSDIIFFTRLPVTHKPSNYRAEIVYDTVVLRWCEGSDCKLTQRPFGPSDAQASGFPQVDNPASRNIRTVPYAKLLGLVIALLYRVNLPCRRSNA